MNRPQSSQKTFRQLRQLPLEVSFEQVEQWVKQCPVIDSPRSRWLPLLLCKIWSTRSKN